MDVKITPMLLTAILVACFGVGFLVLLANCVLAGRTCPPEGAFREVAEDLAGLVLGFVGGRYSR
jgi:hypothetical protein